MSTGKRAKRLEDNRSKANAKKDQESIARREEGLVFVLKVSTKDPYDFWMILSDNSFEKFESQVIDWFFRLVHFKQIADEYLSYIGGLEPATVATFEFILDGTDSLELSEEHYLAQAVEVLSGVFGMPPSLVTTFDLRNAVFDTPPRKVVKERGAAQTAAKGVPISDESPKTILEFNKVAALQGTLRLNELDFAQLSASEIQFLQSALEGAAKHRAKTDLFGAGLGKNVSVQRVNSFLKLNAGKILETHEKLQLVKVIQDLMKQNDLELWKECDGWRYRCTISTVGRADAKTRAFRLSSSDGTKIPSPQSSTLPSNLELTPKT